MKQKRRLKLSGLATLLTICCVLVGALYLVTSTLLKSYNVQLTKEYNSTIDSIIRVQADVDSETMQVKELSEYNKIVSSLTSDMKQYPNQVITISN